MIGKHILLTLMVGAAVGVSIWKYAPAQWSAMQIAGVCLLSAGFVLWTVARFQLGASFAISAQARHLVTHGLYSKIRNPIYVFGALTIAGAFIWANRPWLFLVFAVLIPLQVYRSRKESEVLEKTFGAAYLEYKRKTWF